MLENPHEIMDKETNDIINVQLNIKLEQVTREALDAVVVKKIKKSKKVAGRDEIPSETGKTKLCDTFFFRIFSKKTLLKNIRKSTSFPSHKKVISESQRTTKT